MHLLTPLDIHQIQGGVADEKLLATCWTAIEILGTLQAGGFISKQLAASGIEFYCTPQDFNWLLDPQKKAVPLMPQLPLPPMVQQRDIL